MSNTRNTTDNYLTKKRKESGYTIKELAEILGCAYSTTSSYFTGFVNPPDDVVSVLCQYLGMDYNECRKEFNKAFIAWGKAHADKYEKVGTTSYQIRHDPADISEVDLSAFNVGVDDEDEDAGETVIEDIYDISEYLKVLYGKIPYDLFASINGMGITAEDILRHLYGKIDYTLYKELVNLG